MLILKRYRIGLCILAFGTLTAGPAFAQTSSILTSQGTANICDEVNIDFIDDPSLTPDERMALMDAALNRSLSKFDACQTDPTAKSASSKDAAGGAAESAGSSSSDGQGNGDSTQSAGSSASNEDSEAAAASNGGMSGTSPSSDPTTNPGSSQATGTTSSVASSDMSGSEKPVGGNEQMATGVSGWTSPKSANDSLDDNQSNQTAASTNRKVLLNGKLPDDIPPADNDSVLEAQIRKAATNEKDPETQKKLWNEYRKYKGLPQVDE